MSCYLDINSDLISAHLKIEPTYYHHIVFFQLIIGDIMLNIQVKLKLNQKLIKLILMKLQNT